MPGAGICTDSLRSSSYRFSVAYRLRLNACKPGCGWRNAVKNTEGRRLDLALDRFQDRSRHLLARLVALTHAEILLSSLCINGEEFINGCYQPNGSTIVGMSFHRLEEVSPGVCPTAGMDQFRATHSIIAAVAIGL